MTRRIVGEISLGFNDSAGGDPFRTPAHEHAADERARERARLERQLSRPLRANEITLQRSALPRREPVAPDHFGRNSKRKSSSWLSAHRKRT